MDRLFATEDEVLDYCFSFPDERVSDQMACQWRDGTIEPLADAIWNAGPNDWWWYIDSGECRVWKTYPSAEEINTPWPELTNNVDA